MAVMEQPFAKRLQGAIKDSGKTPYRIAKDAKISTQHLYRLLSGERKPTDDAVDKLAPALGLSVGEMLTWVDEERRGPERLAAIRNHIPELKEAGLPSTISALRSELEGYKQAFLIIQKMLRELPADASEEIRAVFLGIGIRFQEEIQAKYDKLDAVSEEHERSKGASDGPQT